MFAGTLPAYATPLSDKRDEARRVKAQLDELDTQVEIASEDYNDARNKHTALTAEIETTKAELAKATARIDTLQGYLSVRANSMYRSGPLQFVEVLLGTADFEEFTTTWELLTEMNRKEAEDVASLKEERAKAERYQSELEVKEAEAKVVLDQMTARKKSIESKLAERKRMLVGLESEIAALEAAEAARAAAAARASVSRAATSERTFPPPTRAPRSEVVNIARQYLGAPYKWGASGPNSFDCSGFTSYVYRQVGVSLPHSSRAQIGVGQRVSRADLQPGDLVFFGSPIHHVGIYVGGGSYIHAPRTGDVVKVASLSRRDYVGASRP
ncbi:MAG: NlpC/P60 family protein [Coriobacteriia bacterium]|nr:NlpC/P60 family protein [Coriobacteriia bacterium]